MHLIDFGPERAIPITNYGSRNASAQLLADGSGETHVYVIQIAAGGEIGPHPAGFGQLFLIASGEAWVAGRDAVRHSVRAGQGAFIARGEMHAKGSASGCCAIMIQVAELTPAGGDRAP